MSPQRASTASFPGVGATPGRTALGDPVLLAPLQQRWLAGAMAVLLAIWFFNGVYLPRLAVIGPRLFWAVDLVQWIALPSAIGLLLWRFARLRPRHYGFAPSRKHGYELFGDGIGVFITAGFVYFVVQRGLWMALDHPPAPFAFPSPTGIWRVLWPLYGALTAGFVESALFLGMPWLLCRSLPRPPARATFVLVTSIIFALAHWEQGAHGVAAAVACHVVCALWFLRYRNLWAVAAGHALIDLLIFA